MKDVSGKELCKILKKHGWELKTINYNYSLFLSACFVFLINQSVNRSIRYFDNYPKFNYN